MARQVLTRVLIPAAAVMTSEVPDYKCCKRTELPIYVPDAEKQEIVSKTQKHEHHEPGYLEKSIGIVRKQIRHLSYEVQSVENMGIKYYNEGVEQAGWLINYLGEEDNMTPKYPAIAIGGLAGYIIALRGGFFRKLIFTSAGALGMASICFPKEAVEYSEIGIEETKKYSHIIYNFIYGVKKGDPPVELPSLPKMPGSVSEAWTMVVDLGKSAKKSIVSDGQEVSVVQKKKVDDEDETVNRGEGPPFKRSCRCPTSGTILCKVEEEEQPTPESTCEMIKPDPNCSCKADLS